MKKYTYWDEELGSYILTEEGKKLSERDMINIIGDLEYKTICDYDEIDIAGFVAVCEGRKKDFMTIDDILYPGENRPSVPPVCGWKLPL